MPLSDPWLSDRMADYAYVRRAETTMHAAVSAAADAFLAQVAKSVRVPAPAFASRDTDLNGYPRESVWRRLVHQHVVPAARRLWQAAFARHSHAPTSDDDSAYLSGLAERMSGFPARVLDRLRAAVTEGRARGETPSQLTARVRALATPVDWSGQVMTMTRTETIAAVNAGAMSGALAEQHRTGTRWEKRWQATPDDRVRHTHREADGQVRPLAEPFTVGGAQLQFPGDPRGPASETVNCRCAVRLTPARRAELAVHPHPTPAPPRSIPMADSPTVQPLPDHLSNIYVDDEGRFRAASPLNEWSADRRMLQLAEDAPLKVRPLPLPLLYQDRLGSGHNGARLGLSKVDRVWREGDTVVMDGEFDMEDPEAVALARKVKNGFVRFISLDVDMATAREVCVAEDGTYQEDCTPGPDTPRGELYTDWRAMGATLLAHPAYPDAIMVSLAASAAAGFAATTTPTCVAPDEASDTGWAPADCDSEGAVPADESGQRPAEQPAQDAPRDPADDADTADDTADDSADDSEPGDDPAGDDLPANPTDEQVDEADHVADQGNGCVAPGPDGAWRKAPCDSDGAVPANPDGTAPADDVTDAANAMSTTGHAFADTSLPWAARTHAWDGDAAASRVAEWATDGDTLDPARMRRAFLVVDGDPHNKGSYKLGVADIIDGELMLVWNGVVAAGAALNGARSETTIPTSKRETAERAVRTLYRKAAEAFDDDAIRDRAAEMAVDTDAEGDDDSDSDSDGDAGHGCVCPDGDDWAPCDCNTEGALPAGSDGRPAGQIPHQRMSAPPADCAPCRGVAVTAAAGRPADVEDFSPPRSWFEDPHLPGPAPVTVDPDTGRIAGHLAQWGTCHVGIQNRCNTPPPSLADYEFFHTAHIATDQGPVSVGIITMDTGHAGLEDTAFNAAAHYDNTGTQAAVVRCGEDSHGIWVAGACLPFIEQDQRMRLSLASFSGDWRRIRGGLELVAVLAVNTPGFPVASRRTGVGGGTMSLVAAGALPRHADPAHTAAAGDAASPDAATVASMVITELDRRDERQRRQTAAHASFSALRQQHHRSRAAMARKKIEKATRPARHTPRADEIPVELAGLGELPNPSTDDIAFAKNWVDKHGGLPPYIKRISKHLTRKGMSKSHAIATAVNVVKKMCATGDTNWPGKQQVNAGSRTRACSAVQRWEAMKAAAKAD